MKQMLLKTVTTLLLFVSANSFAQTSDPDFKEIDDHVKSLGSLDTLNMGTISYTVTKNFPDNRDKVRAIFDWIAYNISYDVKAGRNNDNEKSTPDLVLKNRKGTAAGYAALFQDMCSVVKIRCLTVDGYAKSRIEQIGEKPDEFNHTWAVVQLGESPDKWYYVDPTWGSGYTDEKISKFTKEYNDDYFFADRGIFNYQHYPINSAWQLGPGPKNLKDFISLPVVKSAAFQFDISRFIPNDGHIKARVKKAVSFNLKIAGREEVEIVALEIGGTKKKKTKTVDHSYSKGSIVFNYEFEEEDVYPVTVLINNKPVLGYLVEVNE